MPAGRPTDRSKTTALIEIWRDIKGYEGKYRVSTHGQVYSYKKYTRKSGMMLKPSKNKFGYVRVALRKEGKTKFYFIHSLVAMMFIPEEEGRTDINHKDCDKTNNHISNIERATRSENMIHAVEHGLQRCPIGEESPQAKLNDEAVLDIRASGETNKYLASVYGVDGSVISRARRGLSWKHVV